MTDNNPVFREIYELYSPVVYDITSRNCDTEAEAEKVTLLIFQKIQTQGLQHLNIHCMGATLIRLAILTINEHLRAKEMDLKQPENKQILQQILTAGSKIKAISERSELTTAQIRRMIRAEFNSIRKAKKMQTHDKILSLT